MKTKIESFIDKAFDVAARLAAILIIAEAMALLILITLVTINLLQR